jgi:hypothetical protein
VRTFRCKLTTVWYVAQIWADKSLIVYRFWVKSTFCYTFLMKKGLTIAVLLVLVVIFVCFVWFSSQSAEITTEKVPEVPDAKAEIVPENQPIETIITTTDTEEEPDSAPIAEPAEPVTFDPATLSSEQKATLESLGVDPETVRITPEMIACAEEKVGRERLDEIIAGAAPGLVEGLSLAHCL